MACRKLNDYDVVDLSAICHKQTCLSLLRIKIHQNIMRPAVVGGMGRSEPKLIGRYPATELVFRYQPMLVIFMGFLCCRIAV